MLKTTKTRPLPEMPPVAIDLIKSFEGVTRLFAHVVGRIYMGVLVDSDASNGRLTFQDSAIVFGIIPYRRQPLLNERTQAA